MSQTKIYDDNIPKKDRPTLDRIFTRLQDKGLELHNPIVLNGDRFLVPINGGSPTSEEEYASLTEQKRGLLEGVVSTLESQGATIIRDEYSHISHKQREIFSAIHIIEFDGRTIDLTLYTPSKKDIPWSSSPAGILNRIY